MRQQTVRVRVRVPGPADAVQRTCRGPPVGVVGMVSLLVTHTYARSVNCANVHTHFSSPTLQHNSR